MVVKADTTDLEKEYRATHKTSQKLYSRACRIMTSGLVHDGHYLTPFPPYIVKADKARKWMLTVMSTLTSGLVMQP